MQVYSNKLIQLSMDNDEWLPKSIMMKNDCWKEQPSLMQVLSIDDNYIMTPPVLAYRDHKLFLVYCLVA